jgi:hypothetical protein
MILHQKRKPHQQMELNLKPKSLFLKELPPTL